MTVANIQNQFYLGAVSVAVIASEMVGGGLAMLWGMMQEGERVQSRAGRGLNGLTGMYRVLGTDTGPDTALTDELTPGVICRGLASVRGRESGRGRPYLHTVQVCSRSNRDRECHG